VDVEERASFCPMPPQPIRASWILSFFEAGGGTLCAVSRDALRPAPAVVPRNSRREVTLYFLSDEEPAPAGAGLGELLGAGADEEDDEEELSDDFVALPESFLLPLFSLPSVPEAVSVFFDSPFCCCGPPLA
jgi:hypothetical protein